jgi:adenylylsulfate kinase
VVVFTSFITPKRELRDAAAEIVGADDFTPVYVQASFETCAERDVKGLYAKAAAGGVKHFTGKDSAFEEPVDGDRDWVIATDSNTEQASVNELLQRILPLIENSANS